MELVAAVVVAAGPLDSFRSLLDWAEWKLDAAAAGLAGSFGLCRAVSLVIKFSLLHFDETYSNVFHTNRKEHD